MEIRSAARGDQIWLRILPVLLLTGLVLVPAFLLGGCYNHKRGNPVDAFHYEHTITISPDYSHVSVQTYINRTQWRVGYRREDLYDGDRDGKLTTPGMDRVQITDYVDVEDPPENAVRRTGDIRNDDERFQRILAAVRAGEKTIKLGDMRYRVRFL